MRRISIFITSLILVGLIIILLSKQFPNALSNDQNKIGLIISLIVATSLISKLAVNNTRFATLFKQLSAWFAVTLLIIIGYSYQYELKQFSNRIIANVIPGHGQGNDDGSVTYYAGQNGHFEVIGIINDDKKVQFLFDTGASVGSLTFEDAIRIGIDVNSLSFNMPLNTANGVSFAARVTLPKIQVGPIIIYNVESVVSKPGASDISLLGMSFLSRLKQFNFQGNSLTLRN